MRLKHSVFGLWSMAAMLAYPVATRAGDLIPPFSETMTGFTVSIEANEDFDGGDYSCSSDGKYAAYKNDKNVLVIAFKKGATYVAGLYHIPEGSDQPTASQIFIVNKNQVVATISSGDKVFGDAPKDANLAAEIEESVAGHLETCEMIKRQIKPGDPRLNQTFKASYDGQNLSFASRPVIQQELPLETPRR